MVLVHEIGGQNLAIIAELPRKVIAGLAADHEGVRLDLRTDEQRPRTRDLRSAAGGGGFIG
ncbi:MULTISPECIES: hypothetical protein [Streptomyces]|uniref:hypothetical protein n=1 Tax=Streptomyces TaxID=1883 RepID=UPI0004BEA1C9|nr:MULTISPECIES: hypothetical protein [Streptomyces]MDX3274743.1 hypothetical protein [Streptomyces scabiei]MDX3848081.1 hypothetical protein [Streptomyces europaeiscabiei]